MEDICKLVGTRIRGFRKQRKLSQEELAEKSDLHPTYIGQLERGEKNPTIESILKIANGLEIPMDQLFVNIQTAGRYEPENYIPDRILFLISELPLDEQRIIYNIILEVLKLKR